MIQRGRARFHPTPDDLQLRELQARYHEVAKRVRDDNPRDVALLKVQRRRWFANLERLYGKVAAGRHIAVQQFDRLIVGRVQQVLEKDGQPRGKGCSSYAMSVA